MSLGLVSSTYAATAPTTAAKTALSPLDGFYIGAGAGYQSADVKVDNTVDGSHQTLSPEGGLLDINLGYGKALSQHFYLGGGLRYDYYGSPSDSKTITSSSSTQKIETQLNDALFLTVQPGLLITPKTLLYTNLGIGLVNVEGSSSITTSYSAPGTFSANAATQDDTKNAFSGIAGIGVRQAFTPNISISAEVDHVASNSSDLPQALDGLSYNEGLVNFIYTFK